MNICVIPAKGSSTRIPRKNVKTFHGMPVIAYSIEAARRSELFSRIIVSTDDDEIAAVSQGYGAEVFRRNEHMCRDCFGPVDVAADLIAKVPTEARFCCVILATAPLMLEKDLQRGLTLLKVSTVDFAISVYGADDRPLTDAAQFIWATTSALRLKAQLAGSSTALVPIDPRRVCDINTQDDWERAEAMYAVLNCKHRWKLYRSHVPLSEHFECELCGDTLPT